MKRIDHVIFSVDTQLPKTKDRVSTQYKRTKDLDIYLSVDLSGPGGVTLDEGGEKCDVPMSNVRRITWAREEPKLQAVKR